LGRLATVTAMGDPHVVPIAFRYNAELDSIDLGGHHIATTAKWRHAGAHPRVSFVVDDVLPPWQPRFIMVTADAELLLSGGQDLGPGFAPELMRLWPVKTTSYGINES
jgi:pyridoxamine 5'-phosphate oxidase family protein